MRAPIWVYRAHLGILLGGRFVLVHHVGRVSGRERRVVVEVVERDPTSGAVTVASGFGPQSDWYRNLLAHPDTTIQLGGRAMQVRARPLAPAEAGEVMQRYARRHPRAAVALAGYMGFEVDTGSEDFGKIGRALPMIRFDSRQP
jgi:deazaflavin-dependent oxidoreductase (nitroreductase family)